MNFSMNPYQFAQADDFQREWAESDAFDAFAATWHTDNDCDMYADWREAYDDEAFAELAESDIDAEVEEHKEWRCYQAWNYFKKHGAS